jgi:hypothetical protein
LRARGAEVKSTPKIFIAPDSLISVAVKIASPMKAAIALVLLVALAACTPMQWVKADADAAARDKDLADCGREAWLEANSRVVFTGPTAPVVVRDAQGRLFTVSPYGPLADPFFLESQLADRCMRMRGWRLEPVKPSN